MSERDDRYARNDLPSTTAEFRATPDASASTAQFQAFAAGRDSGAETDRPGLATDGWPEQPWAGEAQARGASRTMVIVVSAIIFVALVVTLVVLFG